MIFNALTAFFAVFWCQSLIIFFQLHVPAHMSYDQRKFIHTCTIKYYNKSALCKLSCTNTHNSLSSSARRPWTERAPFSSRSNNILPRGRRCVAAATATTTAATATTIQVPPSAPPGRRSNVPRRGAGPKIKRRARQRRPVWEKQTFRIDVVWLHNDSISVA